jgi:hypothetical protein
MPPFSIHESVGQGKMPALENTNLKVYFQSLFRHLHRNDITMLWRLSPLQGENFHKNESFRKNFDEWFPTFGVLDGQ